MDFAKILSLKLQAHHLPSFSLNEGTNCFKNFILTDNLIALKHTMRINKFNIDNPL